MYSSIPVPETLVMTAARWSYLVRSVEKGKNILLTGPSGAGKTTAVQEVAKVFPDRPYYYFNMGATQDARSTLVGNTHYSPEKGTYVQFSVFSRAIQEKNAVILLDELTRADRDAWNILMTVTDPIQRYLRVDEAPDTPTIKVAEGVSFLATANIGSEYTGTKQLDRALLDRFTVVLEMSPMPIEKEYEYIVKRVGLKPEHHSTFSTMLKVVEDTRTASKDSRLGMNMVSTRTSLEMAELLNDGFSPLDIFEVAVYPLYPDTGGTSQNERTKIKQLVQKHMGTS